MKFTVIATEELTVLLQRIARTLLAAAAALVATVALAQSPVEVSFYYPVAVGGPITKIIDGYAADFEKENPGIKIRPIYSGSYQESITKALTAVKSGEPPVTSILLSTGFPYWLFQALAIENGVQLMNEAGTQTYYDRPEVIEALQYWVDLAKKHKVHPEGIVEWGTTPKDFFERKMAFICSKDHAAAARGGAQIHQVDDNAAAGRAMGHRNRLRRRARRRVGDARDEAVRCRLSRRRRCTRPVAVSSLSPVAGRG
jgi:Bacterial extracellular solute-binding protein